MDLGQKDEPVSSSSSSIIAHENVPVNLASSSNSLRIRKYRLNLTEEEKNCIRKVDSERKLHARSEETSEARANRLAKEAEQKRARRKCETKEKRKERLEKDAIYQKMKRDKFNDMPSQIYLIANMDQRQRYKEIALKHPEFRGYIECGFFVEPGDRLNSMDSDIYKKIWLFCQNNKQFLDCFLHLNKGISEEAIEEDEMNKLRYWKLEDFKTWANKFIKMNEAKNNLLPKSLKALVGLEGFRNVKIQLKFIESGKVIQNGRFVEFLVTDGECKGLLILPPTINGIKLGQEILVKKCAIFWNDIGCPYLHLYASMYMEMEVSNIIENVKIEELYFPGEGNPEMEE